MIWPLWSYRQVVVFCDGKHDDGTTGNPLWHERHDFPTFNIFKRKASTGEVIYDVLPVLPAPSITHPLMKTIRRGEYPDVDKARWDAIVAALPPRQPGARGLRPIPAELERYLFEIDCPHCALKVDRYYGPLTDELAAVAETGRTGLSLEELGWIITRHGS